ncbi:MAG TPA: RNA polymerase sigma-54 factor, partial [Alphaproteobacteria bacterium]|nr:RNA polymerase sigma-54 factor [Alphaproteobacteria bacterium]
MAISPKLEVRQSQSLVMTPQLQQAIKLLQLSNIELASYVEQELERNPVLERQDDDGGPAEAAEPPGRAAEPRTDRGADSSAAEGDGARLADTEGGDGPLDTDYANDYTNDSA